MKVNDVSKITGVSIRALQYYDKIGLLKPNSYSKAGYRMYDEESLFKLQEILLLKELEFPLNEIKEIINLDNVNRDSFLDDQIKLLEYKKEHLEKLIDFAKCLKIGDKKMDFSAFEKEKLNRYQEEAKAKWGETKEYKEFSEKDKNRNDNEKDLINKNFMEIFAEFGKLKTLDVKSDIVVLQVKKLQDYITKNYYQCSNEILANLGIMYESSDEFKKNIDSVGGTGTASFVSSAIKNYVNR